MVFLNIMSGQTDPANIMIPDQVWGLLGISAGAAVAQPFVNTYTTASRLADEDEVNRQIGQMQKMTGETNEATKPEIILTDQLVKNCDPHKVTLTGQLVKNCDPSQATISNLFHGDEIGNFLSVDVSKVQSFLFTFLIVLGYGAAIGSQVISTTAFHSLPLVGANVAALMGISQGSYVAYKAAPHSTTPSPSQ